MRQRRTVYLLTVTYDYKIQELYTKAFSNYESAYEELEKTIIAKNLEKKDNYQFIDNSNGNLYNIICMSVYSRKW